MFPPFEWLLSPVYQFNLEHPLEGVWSFGGRWMPKTIPLPECFHFRKGDYRGQSEGWAHRVRIGGIDHPGGVSL